MANVGNAGEPSRLRSVSQKVMTRLQTIEVVLNWEGAINGVQLSKWYGITSRQASQDLSLYAEINSGAMYYNGSSKRFEVESGFSPRVSEATERDYLRHLECLNGLDDSGDVMVESTEGLDMLTLPSPKTSTSIFRDLVRAVRNNAVISFHLLAANPESEGLDYLHFEMATALKLVHLPLGWYLRIYNHSEKCFELIRVNRIHGDIHRPYMRKTAPYDKAWDSLHWFVGEPSPQLTQAQSQLVLADWGRSDYSQIVFPVREALGGLMLTLLNNLDSRLRFRVIPLTDQRWIVDPIKDQEIAVRIHDLKRKAITPKS